jgi:ERF superfamily
VTRSLTERAEQAAETISGLVGSGFYREPAPAPPQIDMSDYEVSPDDPEMVPVHIAWLRVRKEVGGIAKREQYKEKDRDSGTSRVVYNFRGVDTTVNTFSPVTLRHGVNILPIHVHAEHRDTTSSRGNKMRECTVTVTWLVQGPKGDYLPPMQSCGEALDTADKGTAKAQSVALRVLLLSSALVPTNEPDPDSQHIDRGEAPIRQPSSYVDEITNPRTSPARLRQIHAELKSARQLDAIVANEHGDDEKIGPMVVRIGRERAAAEEVSAS